jgi:hypothetical protein
MKEVEETTKTNGATSEAVTITELPKLEANGANATTEEQEEKMETDEISPTTKEASIEKASATPAAESNA